MSVVQLEISNLRNIVESRFEPGSGLNLFLGPNGSGKTTALEAIHLLAYGRSFRCRRWEPLVRTGAQRLVVFVRVAKEEGVAIGLGLERSPAGLRLRVDGQGGAKLSDLAAHLPVQVLAPGSHAVVEGGPEARRRFLDWGAFHVEHEFLDTWRTVQRVLRQRNAALRSLTRMDLSAWDGELVAAGERLSMMRQRYVEELRPVFGELLCELLPEVVVELEYVCGWDPQRGLAEVLAGGRGRDMSLGFTERGPHRADVRLLTGEVPAQERVSRGQQKLVVVALHLAQVEILRRKRGRRCVLLVDDLWSELDRTNAQKVLGVLRRLDGQVFMSSVDAAEAVFDEWEDPRMFHVEHGEIKRHPLTASFRQTSPQVRAEMARKDSWRSVPATDEAPNSEGTAIPRTRPQAASGA